MGNLCRKETSEHCWIGITDLSKYTTSGKFVSIDDKKELEYTNWSPGEPNHLTGEDCVHYDSNHKDSAWNDERCKKKLYFICTQLVEKSPDANFEIMNEIGYKGNGSESGLDYSYFMYWVAGVVFLVIVILVNVNVYVCCYFFKTKNDKHIYQTVDTSQTI